MDLWIVGVTRTTIQESPIQQPRAPFRFFAFFAFFAVKKIAALPAFAVPLKFPA
jgi:hypothetical protein